MYVRQVRGILFLDYVRMLKARKAMALPELEPEDFAFLATPIVLDGWYPMDSFERMGNAILRVVANGQISLVELWGRYSAGQQYAANVKLLAPGDPVETLNRFRVLRETFFDFNALELIMLHDEEALIEIHYYMGQQAEEAASYQALGFFAALLELAGARDVTGTFRQRSWAGDAKTVLQLRWSPPGS